MRLIKEQLNNDPNVKVCYAGGTYNYYTYLYNDIQFDETKMIAFQNEEITTKLEKDKKGGVIILSTDVSALMQSGNEVADFIRGKWDTIKNRLTYGKKINKVALNNKEVGGWTIGRYLRGRYVNNGQVYDENSISVELLFVTKQVLIDVAKELCREFNQQEVIVKSYSDNEILFINSNMN